MKRNVILIVTDQQHFRTLGCNGAEEAKTPNIDALAKRGINFQNHFVTNPVCSPSRASLWTGLHTTEHGLWANGCSLNQDIETIPLAMSASGYTTAHFGKLHLVPILSRTGKHPNYGFDICEVSEGDQQLINDEYFSWLRQHDPRLFLNYLTEMYGKGHDDGYVSLMPVEKHLSTFVTDRALTWLEDYKDEEKPFFLSIGYFDPHHAFNPCKKYAELFTETEITKPIFHENSLAARPSYYQTKEVAMDSERITNTIRAYHAMVTHIDDCVGRLKEWLDESGHGDDTVVIFTSDHGDMMGNHGMLHKGPFLLDDLLRVPMIVSLPGKYSAKAGKVEDLSSGVDLFPTVLAVSGVRTEVHGSGIPMLDENFELFPLGKRDHVLAEWESVENTGNNSLRCIRTADSKLIYYNNDTCGEFYDLKDDPNEFFNHYECPEYRERRDGLFAELSRVYLKRKQPNFCDGTW